MHKLELLDSFKNSLKALNFIKYLFLTEKASIIIPCYNEEATVGKIIKKLRSSPIVGEILVVDDGSTDGSAKKALEAGAKVVRHKKNKGKGAAILTGAHAAKNSIIVFIDADFENVSTETIETLAQPLLDKQTNICKAMFDREGGRVTELTAKPLLEFIFPEVTLSQPLSGQFAIRKEFLEQLEISKDWGIDISIVLDSVKLGEQIIEVNIGTVKHKHRPLNEISKTAKEVTKIILQKAGFLAKKHKLIAFDFDLTLTDESSIAHITRELGLEKPFNEERQKYYSGKISERELSKKIALLLKGIPEEKIRQIAGKTKKKPFAEETLNYLKRMNYKIAIISFAFEQTITSLFSPSLFDAITSPSLETKNGIVTGKVKYPPHQSKEHVFSKGKALKAIMKKTNSKPSETIAIGNSEADQDMFKEVEIAVSIGSKKLNPTNFNIKSLSEIIIIAS